MAIKSSPSMLRRISVYARSFLIGLIPGSAGMTGHADRTKNPHSHPYLDGLRGYAALAVFSHNYFPWRQYWLFNLPFVNIFKAVNGMTMLFYVISGFVLSHAVLKSARARDHQRCLEKLGSRLFRRYLRLFLPVFGATFVSMILVYVFGWMTPKAPAVPKRLPSLFAQIYDWMLDCTRLGNPFAITGRFHRPSLGYASSYYNFILWSIPVEYCGSVLVLAYCAASYKMSVRARSILCVLLIIACYAWTALYAAMFLAGALLADLSLSRSPSDTHLPSATSPNGVSPKVPTRRRRLLYLLMFVLSIFLLSRNEGPIPKEERHMYWPWQVLNKWAPRQYRSELSGIFYPSFGAVLLVWSLDAYPLLRKPLEWRLSQYLGEISYGVYATQLITLTFKAKIVTPLLADMFGRGQGTVLLGYMLCWPILLWTAEIFSRFDHKCMGLAQWLEKKVSIA